MCYIAGQSSALKSLGSMTHAGGNAGNLSRSSASGQGSRRNVNFLASDSLVRFRNKYSSSQIGAARSTASKSRSTRETMLRYVTAHAPASWFISEMMMAVLSGKSYGGAST